MLEGIPMLYFMWLPKVLQVHFYVLIYKLVPRKYITSVYQPCFILSGTCGDAREYKDLKHGR